MVDKGGTVLGFSACTPRAAVWRWLSLVPAGGRSRLAPVAKAAVVAMPAASLRHILRFYMQQKARRFGGLSL